MNHDLDNIMWHSLCGPHAALSRGSGGARRYAPGFPAMLGFANPQQPDWEGVVDHCEVGEALYCEGWTGAAPVGWKVDFESTMLKMLWDGRTPDDVGAQDLVQLGPELARAALGLTELTRPGPFGLRSFELGDYFGCFDGSRLVAMAGERMRAGDLREISGVCTHPDFQGRGLARRLMLTLIGRQLRRGQTPCLHVLRSNLGARRLYASLGFRDYRETVVRVVSRV